jgi:hypothetical protein
MKVCAEKETQDYPRHKRAFHKLKGTVIVHTSSRVGTSLWSRKFSKYIAGLAMWNTHVQLITDTHCLFKEEYHKI